MNNSSIKIFSAPSRREKNFGFTLVEVLVAMFVTVIVAALAYGFLHQVIEAKTQGTRKLDDLEKVEGIWQVLATDLNHVVNRAAPAASTGFTGSAYLPSFLGGTAAQETSHDYGGEYVLRLVRDGWSNPLQQPRSELQRVGYRWFEGQLWRDYWAELNQPFDDEPNGRRLLITDLEEIRVRFLPNGASSVVSNDWVEAWPASAGQATGGQQAGAPSIRPVAMEITLVTKELGEVQRIFSFAN